MFDSQLSLRDHLEHHHSRKAELEDDARKFLRDNPTFWPLFERFAFEAIARGRKHFSVSMIVERIRWYSAIETNEDDGYKINNNHRAYFARFFEEKHPEHAGFFRMRDG